MEQTTQVEMYCYDGDVFFTDLSDLSDQLGLYEEEDIKNLDEDYAIEAKECDLEPVFKLTIDWIMGCINEDRFDEEGQVLDTIYALLHENINFDKINEGMPKLYYPSRRKVTFTKQDFLDLL